MWSTRWQSPEHWTHHWTFAWPFTRESEKKSMHAFFFSSLSGGTIIDIRATAKHHEAKIRANVAPRRKSQLCNTRSSTPNSLNNIINHKAYAWNSAYRLHTHTLRKKSVQQSHWIEYLSTGIGHTHLPERIQSPISPARHVHKKTQRVEYVSQVVDARMRKSAQCALTNKTLLPCQIVLKMF